jgi:hypothetical protein
VGFSHRREDIEEWKPASGLLLRELAANPALRRLTALKVEPIKATAGELLGFADTPLACQLEELILWVEFGWNSHEELRASAGFVKDEIRWFVAEHGSRLRDGQA